MINKAIIVGNLGADPETRFTTGGKCVGELRVATSYGFGEAAKTEWHRGVIWEKTAEACGKYLKKGSKVYVEGRIQTRSYEDKEGAKRYVTEIVANEVKFLDGKGADAHAGPSYGTSDQEMPF
jgi:single-strand DNA-binding protein